MIKFGDDSELEWELDIDWNSTSTSVLTCFFQAKWDFYHSLWGSLWAIGVTYYLFTFIRGTLFFGDICTVIWDVALSPFYFLLGLPKLRLFWKLSKLSSDVLLPRELLSSTSTNGLPYP